MFLLASILVAILTAPVANAAQAPEFRDALILLKEGKASDAYSKLEEIEPSNHSFLPALVELQKVHYKKQEWEKFFAVATFYRKKFLPAILDIPASQGSVNGPVSNTESSELTELKAKFYGRFLSLEALALGKHCLWDEAMAVALYGAELAKRVQSPDLDELEQTIVFLQLMHEFPKIKEAAPGAPLPQSVFSRVNYWPMNQSLLQSIQHPRVLRFKIKGRCSP